MLLGSGKTHAMEPAEAQISLSKTSQSLPAEAALHHLMSHQSHQQATLLMEMHAEPSLTTSATDPAIAYGHGPQATLHSGILLMPTADANTDSNLKYFNNLLFTSSTYLS